MKRLGFAFGAVVLMFGFVAARGEAPKPNDVSAFMKLKLEHSQKILAGIVLEDYDSIRKHAQDLSLLGEDEMWGVFQTPDYLRHSNDFRRATDALGKAAKARNIDGATLAYLDMTMKCVQCHKWVRDTRMARGEPAPEFGADHFALGMRPEDH